MGSLIHALKKRLRGREREVCLGGVGPFNLLIIALCGLASLPFLLAPRKSHPCSVCVYAKTKETS